MDPQSVFYEEWLRSLREQYKQVLRNNDVTTLSSLTAVMRNVGFRDDELAQLRLEATMHVDDVRADFSADLSILDQTKIPSAHPAECACGACMPINEDQFNEEGQPISPDRAANENDTRQVFPAAEISETEAPADTEPVTFADSVAANALETEAAEPEPSGAEDEGEPDPDAPAQMNLF